MISIHKKWAKHVLITAANNLNSHSQFDDNLIVKIKLQLTGYLT